MEHLELNESGQLEALRFAPLKRKELTVKKSLDFRVYYAYLAL